MNITGIARENFEEAGLPLKNTIELTTKNEYTIPDIWGLKVGRKFLDTGEIESQLYMYDHTRQTYQAENSLPYQLLCC